jgi:hypothetical protein
MPFCDGPPCLVGEQRRATLGCTGSEGAESGETSSKGRSSLSENALMSARFFCKNESSRSRKSSSSEVGREEYSKGAAEFIPEKDVKELWLLTIAFLKLLSMWSWQVGEKVDVKLGTNPDSDVAVRSVPLAAEPL